MKRRNFFKGLAALALSPMAVLAKTEAPTSPAQAELPPYKVIGVQAQSNRADMIRRMKHAIRKNSETAKELGDAAIKARRAAEEMRETLQDIYMTPEALEDIRPWGEAVNVRWNSDSNTWVCPEPEPLAKFNDYRAVAHKSPLVCTGWGYDKPNRNWGTDEIDEVTRKEIIESLTYQETTWEMLH